MSQKQKTGAGAEAPAQTENRESAEAVVNTTVLEQKIKDLTAKNQELQLKLDKLEQAQRKGDGVHLNGRTYKIMHGPMAAKWILDEVKKGHLEEDRLVVALGD